MARGLIERRIFSSLWEAIWSDRRRTSIALALLILAKVAGVGVPLLLKAIVDRFSQPGGLNESISGAPAGEIALVLPVFLLLAYALLRFAGTLFTELRDLVFAPLTLRTVTHFAERTFTHLMALSPRFHVQRNTGSLIRDVERGTSGIAFLLGAGLFTVLPTLIEFGAVLAIMAAGYSLWFTLIIFVTFMAYAWLTTQLTGLREVRQRRVNELDSQANGRMVDSLLNYETVKTYAREAFERQRYGDVLATWADGSIANQRALSTLHIGQGAVIAAGVAAVMLLAGQQTLRGTMTVGDLVLVNAYIIQICLPLNALGFVFRQARDALVNTERLFALLDEPAEIRDAPESRPLVVRGGAIAFEHLDFGYEAGRQVLFDVSFSIGAGKTAAVVGGSGSGKSTLARLLLRLYDAHAGRITVDGQDLRSVQMQSLRDAIGIVPQDTVLFNETIGYNIAYGRSGASLAEAIEAAKAAQVHEFILSLPQQYDTVVGERGLKLSGGEKQRIAIARAFLKNPPIMIFDEATSALDTRAERAIQRELDRIAEGRTTLIIAHRLSTIVDADEIIVMDKGRIVERGRHAELLEHEGLYAQLWNLQLQQQEVERLERRMARQPVNLTALLVNVLDGIHVPLDARQVRLYSDIDLESGSVVGDPTTLSEVLRELCLWALQATPRGGRIEVALKRDAASARIMITDGRHAAAPEGLPALPEHVAPFDPLRARSTIERQGGRFTVEAPAAHRGMRYVVELPLRGIEPPAEVPAVTDEAPPHLPEQPLEGLQVLVVDDNDDARESLEALLEAHGAAVRSFASGSAMLAWLQAEPSAAWPQAIVCDIVLGEEDGYAVIHRVRQIEAERHIALEQRVPAIALTGLAQSGDRMRAMLAGFQLHMAKPADPEALVGALYALAGRGEVGAVA